MFKPCVWLFGKKGDPDLATLQTLISSRDYQIRRYEKVEEARAEYGSTTVNENSQHFVFLVVEEFNSLVILQEWKKVGKMTVIVILPEHLDKEAEKEALQYVEVAIRRGELKQVYAALKQPSINRQLANLQNLPPLLPLLPNIVGHLQRNTQVPNERTIYVITPRRLTTSMIMEVALKRQGYRVVALPDLGKAVRRIVVDCLISEGFQAITNQNIWGLLEQLPDFPKRVLTIICHQNPFQAAELIARMPLSLLPAVLDVLAQQQSQEKLPWLDQSALEIFAQSTSQKTKYQGFHVPLPGVLIVSHELTNLLRNLIGSSSILAYIALIIYMENGEEISALHPLDTAIKAPITVDGLLRAIKDALSKNRIAFAPPRPSN